MDVSRVKKGHCDESLCAITALPRELLVEIAAKVASHSVSDLCMVKLTCKEFLVAAEDNYVYQHASMDNFGLVPLQWFTADKELAFLKRCKESDNMEILYREGMVEYFIYLKVESGLEKLNRAALKGHGEARYVSCMLLMCSENDEERNQGFHLFSSFKKSMCSISMCRKRVRSFIRSMWIYNFVIRSMWINNFMLQRNPKSSFQSCTYDDSSKNLQKEVPRSWSSFIEDEHDGFTGSCESCQAEHELSLFCKNFQS